MKILVPTKRVPATDDPVRVRPDGLGIDTAGRASVVNPFDAIALEEALRLREQGSTSAEVIAVSVGGADCENELRTALAMGVNRAMRVDSDAALDPWCVARVLAAVVAREQPDLVLMGKQAVDDDANQTGQMLAGLLRWPQATFASRIEIIEPGLLRVARETDRGLETVQIRLPAVVTTDLRLNEPRYAPLPALIKARRLPIEILTPAGLGVTLQPKLRVVRLEQATLERACVRVADTAELVRRLRFEAKVI